MLTVRLGESFRLPSRWTGRLILQLLSAAILVLAGTSAPSAQTGPRVTGPLVALPHCDVISHGCSLDPESPDLNPAGCASTIARRLNRRGLRAEVIGPGSVVCGEGSNALILEGTLTAHCPARAENELALDQVLLVRLELELELKDCFSGEVLGRGRAKRAFESGRHILVRDAVEELSHHTSERRVRSIFPDTPIRWMRGDVGGETSIELSVGTIDVSGSEINDFLETVDLDEEDYAHRILVELAYNPESSQTTRVSIGMEYIAISAEGDGDVDLADLGREPDPNNPNDPHQNFDPNVPHRVEMDLRILGLRGSVSQGYDFTKNQRIAIQGAIGYYVLGSGLTPASVTFEGLPDDSDEFRDSSLMLEGVLRYTWRVTPHIAFSVGYGFNYLEYSRPNRRRRAAMFPYDLDFTGQSIRIGLAGRY